MCGFRYGLKNPVDDIGKDMNSTINKEVGPVCKFGPGGDFVSFWPKDSARRTPVVIVENGNEFEGQSMLFSACWKIHKHTENKPKKHIQAHRRVAKKRRPADIAGQGLLFTKSQQNAKTA